MEKVFTAMKRQNKCSKGNLNSASGSVTRIPSTKKSFYNFIVRIMNSLTVCDVHVYTDSLQNDLKLRAWYHVINVKPQPLLKKCNSGTRVGQLYNYWFLSLCIVEMVVFEQAKLSEKLRTPPLLIQRTSIKAEDLSVCWSGAFRWVLAQCHNLPMSRNLTSHHSKCVKYESSWQPIGLGKGYPNCQSDS